MYVALRFLSLILIVAALMLLGGDLISSLEKGGMLHAHSLREVWMLFNRNSETAFDAWMQRALPAFAERWIDSILGLWAWAVLGVVGVVLAFLFGRRTAHGA